MSDELFMPSADELWPWIASEFEGWDETERGEIPRLPQWDIEPWAFIDKESSWSFVPALEALLSAFGTNVPQGLDITVDETKGLVHIDERASIEPGSHFIGPCYIAPGATVRHGAYVREYSWICWGALLGHSSEIKHSVLLPKAKAPHFNYVGNSIIGSDANLGAGVILSNLRNDGGEVIVRSEGHRLASRLRKFGALIGDGVQLGCNTVTNPGVILAKQCMAHPNSTVTGVHPEGTVLH
jgi:NDP-sugar pyrophosphorylase family protein